MSGWICARTIRARVLVHVYIPSPVHTHTTQYTQNTIDTVVRAKKKRALLRGIRMRCMRKKCMRAKNAYMQNACMRNACMRNVCMRNVQKNVQMHASRVQQPQLPRTRLSRRVDASSCWSTNKSTWPLAKCAGKTVDKSLPNACPHACFAAYAWPAADLARPCAPFRSTQCNVPAGTACRAWRCVLKPTSQRLTFEHSKKRWKMVLIYSQHIWFVFVFFWGDVTVSSLFISRPGQTVVTNFIYNIQLYIMCAGVTWRWGWWWCFQGEEMQYMMLL